MTRRRENREAIRWAVAAAFGVVFGAGYALWIFVIEPVMKAWGWVG